MTRDPKLLALALRCAEFEARHMGWFEWSRKELNAAPSVDAHKHENAPGPVGLADGAALNAVLRDIARSGAGL